MKLQVIHCEPIHPDVLFFQQAVDRVDVLQLFVFRFCQVVQGNSRRNSTCFEVLYTEAFEGTHFEMGVEDVIGSILAKDPIVEIKGIEATSKPFAEGLRVFFLD
mgnify:CR=1 FL=1